MASAFSPPSTSRKTTPSPGPSCLPHSLQRCALRRGRLPRRARPLRAVRQRQIHLRLSGRPRPLHVRRRLRQHAPRTRRQGGPAAIDESTDTYDSIDWLIKNHPQQQRQRRHVGHLLPRFLHRRRHHRRPPGAQGRVPASAHRRLVHRRRFPPQRRALSAARVQFLLRLRPPAPGAHHQKQRPLRPRHARWLLLLSEARAAQQRERKVLQKRRAFLERDSPSTPITTPSGRPATCARI